jgi:TrpR-related protein YerC/YecD
MDKIKQWQSKEIKELFKVFAGLDNAKTAARFFRDLCTLEELREMAARWQAVRMLDQNKPYREIAQKTGLSTTTVTRVAHWLNYGEGGYRLMLKKLRIKN